MNVSRPVRLSDALADKAAGAVPVAGATDLWVHWPTRLAQHDRRYVDLSLLHDLRRIEWSADHVRIGALTTYWDVLRDPRFHAEFPILPAAARQVGAVQIQTRGTWAGNIANGSPAADGVTALMACDAAVVLAGVSGERVVSLECFYKGYKVLDLAPDELITGIRLPRAERSGWRFEKVGARSAQAISKVGLAMARAADGWRIVVASMAPTVRRCPSLEAVFNAGHGPDLASLLAAAGRDLSPIDDIRSQAMYRMRALTALLAMPGVPGS
ncbi:MAG: FAD binding domain-containing protein [Phycisphaerae bacterium]|nr:FAD binding domain-containing protein [Phycisphaerae bacterium]